MDRVRRATKPVNYNEDVPDDEEMETSSEEDNSSEDSEPEESEVSSYQRFIDFMLTFIIIIQG